MDGEQTDGGFFFAPALTTEEIAGLHDLLEGLNHGPRGVSMTDVTPGLFQLVCPDCGNTVALGWKPGDGPVKKACPCGTTWVEIDDVSDSPVVVEMPQ